MKSQVGPVSKELKSISDTEAFLAKEEVGVLYFGGESSLKGDNCSLQVVSTSPL